MYEDQSVDHHQDYEDAAVCDDERQAVLLYDARVAHAERDRLFALVLAGLLTSVIVIGSATSGTQQVVHAGRADEAQAEAKTRTIAMYEHPVTPVSENPYDQLSVQAAAYVVYDVDARRVLASKNPSEPRVLASLTKVMTSLVALEERDREMRLAIDPRAIEMEGDSGLYARESWKLGDLVSFTMLASSNDGAGAIAAAVGALPNSTPDSLSADTRVRTFVDRMNARSSELGLQSLSFTNPTGLDSASGTPGGLGTAQDMAKLMAYAWRNQPDVFLGTDELMHTYTSLDGFMHTAENTNESTARIYGLRGGKTGYTDMAGGNLGVVYDAGFNHEIVVVVLGSTLDGRFSDVEALVDATNDYIVSGWYEYEVAGSTPRG